MSFLRQQSGDWFHRNGKQREQNFENKYPSAEMVTEIALFMRVRKNNTVYFGEFW